MAISSALPRHVGAAGPARWPSRTRPPADAVERRGRGRDGRDRGLDRPGRRAARSAAATAARPGAGSRARACGGCARSVRRRSAARPPRARRHRARRADRRRQAGRPGADDDDLSPFHRRFRPHPHAVPAPPSCTLVRPPRRRPSPGSRSRRPCCRTAPRVAPRPSGERRGARRQQRRRDGLAGVGDGDRLAVDDQLERPAARRIGEPRSDHSTLRWRTVGAVGREREIGRAAEQPLGEDAAQHRAEREAGAAGGDEEAGPPGTSPSSGTWSA